MAKQRGSEDAERLGFLMGQIMRRLFSGSARKARFQDITTGQLKMLRILGHEDNCTMKELAGMADVTMPTATGLVDRMVESGLAVRSDDPSDRRVVRVKLTAKAKALRTRWRQRRVGKIDQVLSGLAAGDQRRFVAAFETIHALLEQQDKEDRVQ